MYDLQAKPPPGIGSSKAANQSSIRVSHLRKLEPRSDFVPRWSAECDLLDSTVQISPTGSIKRHSTVRHGMVTESIYAPTRSKIEFRFDGRVHLLVMYDDGARRGGETSIEGLAPSRLRNFANKLTFVPAGHAYHEWHETSRSTRMTYLYLNPANPRECADEDVVYVPRAFFDDSVLWKTATKLKSVIEGGQVDSMFYLQALTEVLAHELPRLGQDLDRISPVDRGGLASWQTRAVTSYVEEHLDERISLITLARLARLSQYHFCRAFKRSFGVPPRQYHAERRVERAKGLLADQSVTNVALALGYPHISTFTVTFRRIVGQTPSEFRRDLR